MRLLELAEEAVPSIDLFLTDGPPEQIPEHPSGDGQHAAISLWMVYTPELPSPEAEADLARALLDHAFGPTPAAGRFWDEGLAGYFAARAGRASEHAEAVARCRQLAVDGLLPPVSELTAQAEVRVSGVVATAATGFAEYLIGRFGVERYRHLLRTTRSEPFPGFEAVYHCPLTVVDRDWRRMLERAELRAVAPSNWAVVRRLLPLGRHHWRAGLAILGCSVLGIAFSLAVPLSFRFLIDSILGRRPLPWPIPYIGPRGHVIGQGAEQLEALAILLGFLGALYAVAALARLRQSTLLNEVGESLALDLRCRLLDLLARLPSRFFAGTTTAEISQRVLQDVASIQQVVVNALVPMIAGGLGIIAFMAVLLALEPRLAAVVMLGLPIIALLHRSRRQKRRAAIRERSRRATELMARVNEFAATHDLVKLYGAAPYIVGRLVRLLEVHRTLNIQFARESSLLGRVGGLVQSLTQIAVLLVGGYIVIVSDGQDLGPGGLVAFYVLMNQLFIPVGQIAAASQTMASASASVERVRELLDQEVEQDSPGAVELGPLREAIRFEGVSFGYHPNKRILKNLSLTIPAGATIALVGPTGAGKSSVVHLLSRLFEPSDGSITWDGIDLRSARLASIRSRVAVVPQEPFLLNTTLYENIRFGQDQVSDQDVERAARQAHAHDFISALPDGYDTVVGARGVILSGGQRQRVALARALLRNPSVLVLDEATSALDATTQRAVHQAIRADDPDRTIIKVAHRLETVADSDMIFVLDDGRVVEQGHHEELLADAGLYARLFRDQVASLGSRSRLSPHQAIRWLARVAPYSELPHEELERLADALRLTEHRAGDTIVEQGSDSDELFIVGRGRVEVVQTDESGRERFVNVLGTGAVIGVATFLRRTPRPVTLHATTDVLLFALHESADPFRHERGHGAASNGRSGTGADSALTPRGAPTATRAG